MDGVFLGHVIVTRDEQAVTAPSRASGREPLRLETVPVPVGEVEESVGFPVHLPQYLPEGYQLAAAAKRVLGDFQSLTIGYKRPENTGPSIVVEEHPWRFHLPKDGTPGRLNVPHEVFEIIVGGAPAACWSVPLRSQTALVVTHILRECGDVLVLISTPALPLSELAKVAGSVA